MKGGLQSQRILRSSQRAQSTGFIFSVFSVEFSVISVIKGA